MKLQIEISMEVNFENCESLYCTTNLRIISRATILQLRKEVNLTFGKKSMDVFKMRSCNL